MKRIVRIRKFSSRIRAVVVIVSAITLLIYNIMCYTSAKKILQEDFFSRSDVVMEQTNEKIDDYMDEFEVNIDLIAENEVLRKSLKSGVYDWNILPMIQNLIAMDRYIINVEIYSKNLNTCYRANDILTIPPNDEMRQVFKDLENTGKEYKTLLVEKDKEEYELTVIRGIYQNDECLGYVLVYVDNAQIVETYNSAATFVESDDIYIADTMKKIVSANTGKLLNTEHSSKLSKFTDEDADSFKRYEMYEAHIENINMSIYTFVSPAYILKQLHRIAYRNAAISILIFILCILGAVGLGKSISEPIEDIKRYIEENMSDK